MFHLHPKDLLRTSDGLHAEVHLPRHRLQLAGGHPQEPGLQIQVADAATDSNASAAATASTTAATTTAAAAGQPGQERFGREVGGRAGVSGLHLPSLGRRQDLGRQPERKG